MDYLSKTALSVNASAFPALPSHSIRADIRFGVLQADGSCLFTGICRIHPSSAVPAQQPVKCREASAFIWLEEGHPVFFFPAKMMSSCTRHQFFNRHLFDVPHPVFLPAFLNCLFGTDDHAIIPAGIYPIHPVDDGFIITFKYTP